VALMKELYTPVALPGASGELTAIGVPGGLFGGFVVHNTGGTAALVKFFDNAAAASGILLGVADLTAAGTVGSFAIVELANPLRVVNGVYYAVTGTVEGTFLLA
jgi:hypothetical protein